MELEFPRDYQVTSALALEMHTSPKQERYLIEAKQYASAVAADAVGMAPGEKKLRWLTSVLGKMGDWEMRVSGREYPDNWQDVNETLTELRAHLHELREQLRSAREELEISLADKPVKLQEEVAASSEMTLWWQRLGAIASCIAAVASLILLFKSCY